LMAVAFGPNGGSWSSSQSLGGFGTKILDGHTMKKCRVNLSKNFASLPLIARGSFMCCHCNPSNTCPRR
jgi:hypothetical protein